MGGIFRTKSWNEGEENKEYAFCIAWGELSRDPSENCVNKPRVEFGLKYRRKEFINCVCWGDSPFYEMCCRLERGDSVAVFGTQKKQYFKNKNGEQKEYFDLKIDFVIPAAAVGAALAAMNNYGETDEPDEMQSAKDTDLPPNW